MIVKIFKYSHRQNGTCWSCKTKDEVLVFVVSEDLIQEVCRKCYGSFAAALLADTWEMSNRFVELANAAKQNNIGVDWHTVVERACAAFRKEAENWAAIESVREDE